MAELKSILDGVSKERKIISYTVDLVSGKCSAKIQVSLNWTSGADSKCLSTSLEDVEFPLDALPELVAGVEVVYKKLALADEVYVATKVKAVPMEVAVVEAPAEEVK